jgi:hypothetical protein
MLVRMQFAERWPRFTVVGSIVVALALVGVATLAVNLRPHHHPHFRAHHHHIQFEQANCVGEAAQPADPLIAVLDRAHVDRCLTTSNRVEMLIEIGADGRVANVTHRPEQPTAESRCLAKAISGLQFPAMPSPLALRKVFER